MSSEMHSSTEATTQHVLPDSKPISIQLRHHTAGTLPPNALRVEDSAKGILNYPQQWIDKMQGHFVNFYIGKFCPYAPHVNRENLSSIIEELKILEGHLINDSLYPGVVKEDDLMKIISYSKILEFCNPYFTEIAEKLGALRQLAWRIIEAANMGLNNLSEGALCIVKNNSHYTDYFFRDTLQYNNAHASLLIDSHKVHMTQKGFKSDPPNRYNPMKFEYLELNLNTLMTAEGMKTLKKTLGIADSQKFVGELFSSILKKEKEEYGQKNIPFRDSLIKASQSLFFKQNQDQLIREHQPMDTSHDELCSTFVAKFIEEAVVKLNHELQKMYIGHLAQYHPEKLQGVNERVEAYGLRFVNSPFPSTWNLDKITPADLVTKFKALHRSKAHWGKFAPFVQD